MKKSQCTNNGAMVKNKGFAINMSRKAYQFSMALLFPNSACDVRNSQYTGCKTACHCNPLPLLLEGLLGDGETCEPPDRGSSWQGSNGQMRSMFFVAFMTLLDRNARITGAFPNVTMAELWKRGSFSAYCYHATSISHHYVNERFVS